ncbi:MAG: hypothetical protein AAGI37_00835 [Planctomycetota bacterium]
MNNAPPYHQILSACEAELQRLATEAMADGDYDSARRGLELAEKVAGLYQEPESSAGQTQARKKTNVRGTIQQPERSSTPKNHKSSGKRIAAKSSKSKAYPRFAKDGDKLVKIGWSKQTREEYEHKAPLLAVEAFSAHLRIHSKEGRIFKIDDIMPVADPNSEGELPSYLIYMALGWLRSIDAVSKHGRSGYSAKTNAISKKALSQAWDQLPSHTVQAKG